MTHAHRTRFGSSGPVRAKMTGQSHRGHRTHIRRGLTLVELLVTVTIMGMVVAISVPIIKPMLASNKTKSGADIVAGFLAQARNRAIEENRPVGVTFERVLNYENSGVYPYNGACVTMRQVAEPRPLSGFVRDVRVAVDASGQIRFRVWSPSTSPPQWVADSNEINYWNKLVNPGDQIQFDGKGPKYEILSGFQIDMTVNPAPPIYSDQQPTLFKVFRKPQPGKVAPTMARPVALPEGIVVDLDSSGTGNFTDKSQDQDGYPICDNFSAAGPQDTNSVTIMFSPTGEVDRIYFSDPDPGKAGQIISEIPAGPIFLNVGIWERSGFWMQDGSNSYISNDYLPDEGSTITNYHDMNNYWVTIFPRTGATRVNRVAPVPSGGAINESREYATSLHGTEVQ